MPKSNSLPKHHNHKGLSASLRAYLNQLEAALLASLDERKAMTRRIAQLESKVSVLEKRTRTQA